ncbi:MAG TPA: acetyl-CoA synthetase, partial [Archaeoglobus sp.]|nr:acetyl-CoA synthetase [Archaeoglobus sp.]
MGLEGVYKEFIEIIKLPDDENKEKAMKSFFDKLNTMQMPEYFNWASEIFEGIHVQERGDQTALLWAN